MNHFDVLLIKGVLRVLVQNNCVSRKQSELLFGFLSLSQINIRRLNSAWEWENISLVNKKFKKLQLSLVHTF